MTIIGDLIDNATDTAKCIVRSLEKLQKKLANARNAVVFDQTCILNGLLPNYTNIRLHDPAVTRRHITQDFKKKLVEEQIKEKKTTVSKLENEQKELHR